MAPFLLRIGWATLAGAIVVLIVLGAPPHAADADKGILADLISRALSSKTTNVSIGAVDGVLSSDASIRDIVLSDRNGPWLKIDKVRLIWSRLALLSRRLEVDQLTIGHMQLLRRPLPAEGPPPDTGPPQPILPELPLKVIVKQFAVQELSLGEPVIGIAARLDISGKATLGPPSEGLDLTLTSRRLDAPGEFKALLTYVPVSDILTLNVDSDEPAGGLFAHFANLPGLPPVKLAFNGVGPLDNFNAKLDFAAGADVWAKGEVVVAREGAGRRLKLDMNSRLEGLTPALIRPVFAGETTLKGAVLFNDDSSIAVPGLHLVSANARLDIEGGKSADNILGLKIHAGAIPGAAQIGTLDLNASIVGPLDGATVEGDLDATQIHVAEGSLDHISASFRAVPSGSLSDEATKIPFQGQAQVSGLRLADPAIARAIGGEIEFALRGSATAGGVIAFDALDLASPDFEAHYAGLLSPKKAHGRLDIAIRDLSRFALLVGGALKGEARIAADLDGAPRYGALTATVDAHATHLTTDFPILDRTTGGDVKLAGAARTLPGGGFGFTDLLVTGQHGSARLDGDYGRDKVDMTARIDVPEAQVLDPRVAGKAQVVASLAGAPSDLAANLRATLSDGRLLDRRTSGLALQASVSHVFGLVDAMASLTGDVDGRPLQGSAHVAKRAEGGWVANNLALGLASARLEGNLTLDADRLANGAVSFSAANLDDLSPLVLTKLGGAVDAKMEAASDGGRQALSVAATSDKMSVGANRVEGLKLNLTVDDLWAAGGISGEARLARAEVAGQSIADVRLTAMAAADASDLDVSGVVRRLAVKARARLIGGPPIRLELASFTAQGDGRRLELTGPATLTYGSHGLDIRNFGLGVDGGRLSLSGRVGSTLDLRASATRMPLAALDFVSADIGLSGFADGEATVHGTPADPSGDWRLRLTRVSASQTRSVSLPPLDVSGSGRLSGGRTSLDVKVSAGAGNSVRLTGSAPLSADGALDVGIDGKLDAGLANATLSVSGRRASGSLAVAMRLRGTIAKPQAQGSIRLVNGGFRDDETGFKLSAINGLIQADGDRIRIDRLAGTTPDGGSIGARGEVRLDPAAGFPGSFRLTGRHAQLVANDTVAAAADMALNISSPLSQKPKVDGRITIVSMDITVPDRFNSVAAPIPGTKHLNPTPTARARLAQLARARAARGRAPRSTRRWP